MQTAVFSVNRTQPPFRGPNGIFLGKFSNRTVTSVDNGKRAESTKHDFQCPTCRSAIGQASFFNLRAQSSTDVPVLLLNQPNLFNGHFDKICYTSAGHALCMALTIQLLLSFFWY